MISQTDPLEGKRISQRFRIKTVDQWHEHTVFCTGEDLEKNRQVSIILVDPLTLKAPDAFEKTAKRKMKLRHANLVSLEDYGQTNSQEHFLALDLVGFKGIDTLLDKKTTLSAYNAVEIISQLIEGLSYLADSHEAPFLPLPDRLVIREDDQNTVKILDLDYSESIADANLLIQKPLSELQAASHTAPECFKGSKPDARAQIYSLGCLLYQLLTGVMPFASDDLVELQSQQLAVEPKRFHEARPDLYLSPRLEACVLKALHKDPAQRPSSLRQFQTDLKDALKQQPWWQKRWRQAAVAASICAVAVYASGFVGQPFWATSAPVDPVDPQPTEITDVTPQPTEASVASMLPPVPADAKKLGRLEVSGMNSKTLTAGDYQCDAIAISGSSKLIAEGAVNLWITPKSEDETAITLSGQGQLCSSAETDKFNVYYVSRGPILMTGDSKLKATVQAPQALLDASGNSTIDGAFTSNGQKLSDKAHFVGGPSD